MTDPVKLEEIEVVGERIRRRTDPNVSIGQTVFSVWNGTGWSEFTPAEPLLMNGVFDGTVQIIEAPQRPVARIAAGLSKTDPDYNKILDMTINLADEIARLDYFVNKLGASDNLTLPNNNTMNGI